ncbi:ribonuclease P protein subunit [Thermococci archaeon]|nr:MAG: ribonuclease P protein subunit [Thermococci archaeon]RLF97312.1 MAG: ribonuclease P protein subunit [Thermococci archaeon]
MSARKILAVLRSGIIGKEVEVLASPDPSLIGVRGEVIDETRKTLKILRGSKAVVLAKENVVLLIDGLRVDGKLLLGRPEERLKKRYKI